MSSPYLTIEDEKFPCIMAKAALAKGEIKGIGVQDKMNFEKIWKQINKTFDCNEVKEDNFKSILLRFQDNDTSSFLQFESYFWQLLHELTVIDSSYFHIANNISSDPKSKIYSFSLCEKAFFVILLHPQSPRRSRQFKKPVIVFNPRERFDQLRSSGSFERVKAIIREKDKLIQGQANLMLADFGSKPEILQYSGRQYSSIEEIPYEKLRRRNYEHLSSA